MTVWNKNPFINGSQWVRSDFHLHTKADKEFKYSGEDNSFVKNYVDALKTADIRVGVIANHNKFDLGEYKAIRKQAFKEGICILPGIELSVNDGANGVHTIVVFSDSWLKDSKDFISQFLATAFKGKVPEEYEQENGRSTQNLTQTLEELENYNKDFFIIFAHVEASSGLWKELEGGRLTELSENPLIQKYCLGFQKVRTHDKPNEKCRVKVKNWWKSVYPAEVEGCDAKNLEQIGRGESSYIKIGDLNFNAVKYGLIDHEYRIKKDIPEVKHSYLETVRFEGGLLDGVSIPFSPHLNCLIGIRGSGKSAVLEAIRYVLSIPFGKVAQDVDYKEELIPYVLQSGGKVILEARDKHGHLYEISRIYKHKSDVYYNGELQSGVSIRETVIWKPLYFGQKDLAAAGKGFGHDLVEKLIGDSLKLVRQKINEHSAALNKSIGMLQSLATEVEQKNQSEDALKDIKFRLEKFEEHGIKEKLDKQIEFDKDASYCGKVAELAKEWFGALQESVEYIEEEFEEFDDYQSKYNAEIICKYKKEYNALKSSVKDTKIIQKNVGKISKTIEELSLEFKEIKDSLKDDFAQTERDLLKLLVDQGVTSIQPDEYVKLSQKKVELESEISDLTRRTKKYEQRQKDVLSAMAALNECWHEEFRIISEALDKINLTQTALKVEASFKGDRNSLVSKLEEIFRGNNIRKDSYKVLAEKYLDFGEMYKDLENASEETKSKSVVFVEQFLVNMAKLLTFQVPNGYKVTYHGKDLKSHSLGQRASAMMLFILSQKDCDLLLIDQPEDDLDGQSIYKEVVKLLRVIKPNQQFIFATHNANFPVLGDAEMIVGCNFEEDEKSRISVRVGSIDSKYSQTKIIDIMEGGKEAFDRRKSIYQQWKS